MQKKGVKYDTFLDNFHKTVSPLDDLKLYFEENHEFQYFAVIAADC